MKTVLEVKGLTKSFGGVAVNNHIDVQLHEGEILALMGENGAGKSTFCKMLTGVYHPDEGEIYVDGEKKDFSSPNESMAAGINMVYQERNLINMLTGAENVCLGNEFTTSGIVSLKKGAQKAYALREELGLTVPLDVPVEKLGVGEQQLIEILRAFCVRPKVLILDEPTSSLGESEVKPFLNFIKRIRETMNISIIFISHKLDEVFDISDRIVVLTDGDLVLNKPTSEVTQDECVAAMLRSDKVQRMEFERRIPAKGAVPVLSVENGFYDGKNHDIKFDVYPGEVVGFYGIVGAGRTECMEHLIGLRRAKKRSFQFNGETITKGSPLDMIKKGMLMTPERRADGMFKRLSLVDNICALFRDQLISNKVFGIVDNKRCNAFSEKVLKESAVKYDNMLAPITRLSGGNMQKVIIGRAFAMENMKLLILDEPTTGIDVGAKAGIYSNVRRFAEERQIGVVFISSELDELLEATDRLYVMANGNVVDSFCRENYNKKRILETAVRGRSLEHAN